MRFSLVLTLALHALACRAGGESTSPDAGFAGQADAQEDTGYPPPRTDLVAPVGQSGAIDIATWNIENFPQAGQTPSLMADLIASLQLDLIAVQEIADEAAFAELVARLPHHDGLLSSDTYGDGTYQKVGYIYRADRLTISGGALLFQDQGFDFPRPPMQAVATVNSGPGQGFDFVLINLHLKAGVSSEDRARRTAAVYDLEQHVRALVDSTDDEVVILGDFNEILDTVDGRLVFEPFLSAPSEYAVRTDGNAQDGEYTFIPSERLLDHVITTSGLDQEISGEEALVRPLEAELSVYLDLISDHRPAFVSLIP